MMTDNSSTTVLVTGTSGFLAMHCTLQLLEKGYNVRGTLRTPSREAHLREVLSRHTGHIRSELDWQPRPAEEAVVGMAESLIEHGLV